MTSEAKRGRPPRRVANARLQKQLAAVARELDAHHAEIRKLEPKRDQLIRRALADGWTHTQIAEVTGLSRGRISQLSP
jgi:DNA-binding NarL/FixJ family response regulator